MATAKRRHDGYLQNPMTTADRRLGEASSAWVRSFSCEDVRPLIVCRGPIRKEALDTFAQMGITHTGILLSEKDSIVYPQALSPEVRQVEDRHIHRIRDYSGATREERIQRTRDIVRICHENGYSHVFAGYGFMAEDPEFVGTLEESGLVFVGPASHVQLAAGLKDEAKRTALDNEVSVTPGVNDATRRTLLRKYPTREALLDAAAAHGLAVVDPGHDLLELADRVLTASYEGGVDLYTIEELAATLSDAVRQLLSDNPGKRMRLKAIGGGGGKGQRLVAAASDMAEAEVRAAAVPGLVREILAEVKAGGVGDNKNILVEMNIEETRHNEIQLLGNGRWCIALGGRDCSLQMHEQKLLEISLTADGLDEALDEARRRGDTRRITTLEAELRSLARMESEAERFGLAVGLDSASTFECIVEGDRHYFMEVNTRIQVEHRVTELCYSLVFENPELPGDDFEVTSLVEAMVLVARHGARLPRPVRKRREGHAVEARLNATNRALEPHAGGMIYSWSDVGPYEIRDDQGICLRNPDSQSFMRYRLAGAYDSNVALLLTWAGSREELYTRLIDMLRRTRIRGLDLQTNLAFHLGLAQWFAARDVWAKPTTRFVTPYLTAVGELGKRAGDVDLHTLWSELARKAERRYPEAVAAVRQVLAQSETLVKRPLERLFEEPHLLSAFVSRNLSHVRFEGDGASFTKNPLEILADLYWLIGREYREGAPAANVIWGHDHVLLERGRAFYRTLADELGVSVEDWAGLSAQLASGPPAGNAALAAKWGEIQAAHAGFSLAPTLLIVPVLLAIDTGFFALRLRDDGSIDIPARLFDKGLQDAMKKVLAPPPAVRSDVILAASGGMFYAQEAPDRPPLVVKGSHFKAGDPLYVIEVMKMFNKVHAPFAGTVDEVLVTTDGTIVQKGQPLFRVTPDEPLVVEDEAVVAARRRELTLGLIGRVAL